MPSIFDLWAWFLSFTCRQYKWRLLESFLCYAVWQRRLSLIHLEVHVLFLMIFRFVIFYYVSLFLRQQISYDESTCFDSSTLFFYYCQVRSLNASICDIIYIETERKEDLFLAIVQILTSAACHQVCFWCHHPLLEIFDCHLLNCNIVNFFKMNWFPLICQVLGCTKINFENL